MKAERQHKEPQQAKPIQSKRERSKLSFVDNRSQTVNQTKLVQSIQRKENKTGLLDDLKIGIENLSDFNMDDVREHYNSDKPAQLQALAYAYGTDIHLRPGQEKHLPHEVWHVVLQKEGRVRPTLQRYNGYENDNKGLEEEADLMGAKALSTREKTPSITSNSKIGGGGILVFSNFAMLVYSASRQKCWKIRLKSLRPIVQKLSWKIKILY